MNQVPHQPLTPEERELARLTAPLGPQGEPSAALDASILAAARAAVGVPRAARRPRWPLGLGLAASVVFAVGIAWQLRPLQETAAVSDVPASAPPMPAATDRAAADRVVNQPEAMAADAAPATVEEPAAATAATPHPPTETPAPRQVQAPAPRKPAVAERKAPAPAPAPAVARPSAPAKPAGSAPPAAAAPPAPAQDVDAFQAADPAPAAPAPAPALAPAPAPPERAATAAASANPLSASAETARREQAATAKAQSTHKAETTRHFRAATPAAPAASAATERIEPGSARLRTDLQVPVAADTLLPVEDWLERVRTRYGLGDAQAARQSLLLFVREHPKEAVPDDLEPLLDK